MGARDDVSLFISRVPKPGEWTTATKRLDLLNAEGYTRLIKSLIGAEDIPDREVVALQRKTDIHGLAQQYARATRERYTCGKQSMTFARFQNLILFSICLILRTKSDHEVVTDLMSWTNKTHRECKAMLKGTERVHQAIVALMCCAWQMSRATELFLLGKNIPRIDHLRLTGATVPLSFSSLIRLGSTKAYQFASQLANQVVNPDGLENSQRPQMIPHYSFLSLIADLIQFHGISLEYVL